MHYAEYPSSLFPLLSMSCDKKDWFSECIPEQINAALYFSLSI